MPAGNMVGAGLIGDTLLGGDPGQAAIGPAPVELAGTIQGSTTVTGSLSRALAPIALAPEPIIGQTSISMAPLVFQPVLAGSIACQSMVSAGLSVAKRFAGVIVCEASVSADLSVAGPPSLAGIITGSTSIAFAYLSQHRGDNLGNDLFADRIPIWDGVSVHADNLGYGKEAGEGGYAESTAWFTWIASATEDVTVTTLGSDFDTVLGIWTGAGTSADTVSSITLITENDDDTDDDPSRRTSSCTFSATAGQTYYFQVGGFDVGQGAYVLNYPAGLEPEYSTSKILEGEITGSTTVSADLSRSIDADFFAGTILGRTQLRTPPAGYGSVALLISFPGLGSAEYPATIYATTAAEANLTVERQRMVTWFGESGLSVRVELEIEVISVAGTAVRAVSQHDIPTGAASLPEETMSTLSAYYV